MRTDKIDIVVYIRVSRMEDLSPQLEPVKEYKAKPFGVLPAVSNLVRGGVGHE